MSTGKKNVPEIRFGGFSEPWAQKKFWDLVNVCSGRDYKHLSEGNIPVYGTGGYMLSVNEALSYDKDAIGIGRKGTIDKPFVLKAPFWTVDTLFYAIPRENVDLNFAFDIFQNIDWKNKDESTGVPSLSKTAINEVDSLVPQHEEQQRIGSFSKHLDTLISQHQHKYEALVAVKKAMLEKMFPKEGENVPEIRFAGFTDPWEQRKLGDITDFVTGKSFSQDLSADGTYVVMDMGTVSQEGNRIETKLTLVNRDVLSENDLVMPKDDIGGGLIIGRTVHIPANNQYVLGDHVYRLRFKNENGLFLHYQINSDSVRKQIMPLVTGSAQLGLNSKNIQGVYVNIPSVDEQVKIGEYFSNLDNLITLHQRKCEVLKNLKSALLRKMFVGTTE